MNKPSATLSVGFVMFGNMLFGYPNTEYNLTNFGLANGSYPTYKNIEDSVENIKFRYDGRISSKSSTDTIIDNISTSAFHPISTILISATTEVEGKYAEDIIIQANAKPSEYSLNRRKEALKLLNMLRG